MQATIGDHIHGLNWGFKVSLMEKECKYYNRLASFVDAHKLKLVGPKGEEEYVTAKYVCVATGGRPTYIDFEGSKEHCISSDDIFWRKTGPGKTLIIGAG